MNKIFKLLATAAICLTLGLNTSFAQTDPNFLIEYSGCELSSTLYTTAITYVIVEIPDSGTSSVVVGPNSNTISYPNFGWEEIVDEWGCDQSTDKIQYMIIIQVDRLDENGIVVCSGELRTDTMPCDELYNGNTYTVILN
jgi:hypothetical protein